jgi:hypothetical protein
MEDQSTNKVAGDLVKIIANASEALDEMSVIKDGITDLLSKIDNLEISLSRRQSNHADDLRSLVGLYRTRELILNTLEPYSIRQYAEIHGGELLRQGMTEAMIRLGDIEGATEWDDLSRNQQEFYISGATALISDYANIIMRCLGIGVDNDQEQADG